MGSTGAKSISTQSSGKNSLSVGAGQIEADTTTTKISYYTSYGPTYDGRWVNAKYMLIIYLLLIVIIDLGKM